jgi:soluble lytic murein transglycosylase-like protein
MRMKIRRAACVAHAFAAALTLAGANARAELWGYIDDHGKTHFANEKLDARYQLFFKGGTSLDAPPTDPTADATRAALERSPLYQRVVRDPNVRRYRALIEQNARDNGLDAALLKAIIAVESAFDPGAVSEKGAVGLMQVMPETGARYGLADDRRRTIAEKLRDPAVNLSIGARYLRDLMVMFADDVALALAAYNAGEQAVKQYDNRVPPYPETRDYVRLVRQLHALYQPPPSPRPVPARPILDLPGKRKPVLATGGGR